MGNRSITRNDQSGLDLALKQLSIIKLSNHRITPYFLQTTSFFTFSVHLFHKNTSFSPFSCIFPPNYLVFPFFVHLPSIKLPHFLFFHAFFHQTTSFSFFSCFFFIKLPHFPFFVHLLSTKLPHFPQQQLPYFSRVSCTLFFRQVTSFPPFSASHFHQTASHFTFIFLIFTKLPRTPRFFF